MSSSLGSSLFAFIAVIAMIPVALWLLKRSQTGIQSAQAHLKTVAVLPMGTRERIALVEVDGKWILVGVTAQSIQTLSVLDRPEGADATAPVGPLAPRGSFASIMETWKHVRR